MLIKSEKQTLGSENLKMLAKLPELILDVLCDHLSYEDVLMLRCTCKSLKTFVDSKRFTTLHLFVRKFSFPRRLFYTGETIGYSKSFHSGDLTILSSSSLKKQFANVQKMTIYHRKSYGDFEDDFYRNNEIDLNDLNCFRELIQLEIYFEICEIKGKLSLPKLQISSFQGFGRSGSFELDCPKLRALKIKLDNKVTLTSATDQLEYLHYDVALTLTDHLKDIRSNLGKLSTIVFETGDLLLQFLSDLQTGSLHAPLLSQIRLEDCGYLGPLDEVASSLEVLKNDPRTKCITFILMGRPIHSPKNELRPIAELQRVYKAENLESHMLFLRELLEELHMDMNELGEEQLNQFMRGNDLGTRNLKDRSFLFIKRHPELQFLFASTWAVRLEEDTELDEEIIKKLKNVNRFEFCSLFRPSDSMIELVIANCKSLRSYKMYHQTVTERLLEIMSEQLLNLEHILIYDCRHESLKPLAKFRNLEYLSLDFDPQRDVQFLFENSRTLEIIDFPCQKSETEKVEGRSVKLLRRTQKPKVFRLTIFTKTYPRPGRSFQLDTLREMIENYTNDFEQLENYEITRM